MSFAVCAAGVVLAIAITAAAITRSLATSDLKSKLLAWAELYLTQAAAVLPDEVAQDLLSEWQADVRTRSQERGALSALRWARGIALEAAPAIRHHPGEGRRRVAIGTFALRLVRGGCVCWVLNVFFATEQIQLAWYTNSFTRDGAAVGNAFVDAVALSVALSLWVLAEIAGTAFAFVFTRQRKVVRPVWLGLRSRRSLFALGTIVAALVVGACGLTDALLNQTRDNVPVGWLFPPANFVFFLMLIAASAVGRLAHARLTRREELRPTA